MIDLAGHEDVPVPEDVLRELAAACRTVGVEFLVIGAAARDLVIHSQQRTAPVRATKDIDIAVAVRDDDHFRALTQVLARKGSAPHKFTVLGVEIDVIPFGGNEVGRAVTFSDGSVFDATGIAEAHATSVTVRLPKGTVVQVASPAALTALKILAWSERHEDNPKDAIDLATILNALSESPFDDDVWNDDEALEATDADIVAAASYHCAKIAARPFAPPDGQKVLDILGEPVQRRLLIRQMRSAMAADLVDAYARGFAAGLI
ncbi:nucleotidyl transferase AbiEii/AbiGii toxin family protein [Brevibacterium spongiae]|uniref:Nucleotidyl transferase AbiEii/AbiGii toxin family protein n=1 Tax=Brevibacterium spongiae TaxID=2909672 RepID=A0ABY5SRE3_9MICO|nr:nucleotidyl transferase AbiEii/AbiGii toxin family protein [Brevibacterium spongiae]UVI36880.1 nucleotidyl transferase AbiEii/AbiGii toxin family protein [Brevibacterium spongiae]